MRNEFELDGDRNQSKEGNNLTGLNSIYLSDEFDDENDETVSRSYNRDDFESLRSTKKVQGTYDEDRSKTLSNKVSLRVSEEDLFPEWLPNTSTMYTDRTYQTLSLSRPTAASVSHKLGDNFSYPVISSGGVSRNTVNTLKRGMICEDAGPYSWPPMSDGWHDQSESVKCCSHEGIIIILGIIGVAIHVALLVIYTIIQAPSLRYFIGYLKVATFTGYHAQNLEDADNDGKTVVSADQLLYVTELVFIVIGLLLGILVNSLLVYGVVSKNRAFTLPWLVLNVFLMILLVLASLLITIFVETSTLKALGIVPIILLAALAIFWTKTWDLYRLMGRRRSSRNSSTNHLANSVMPCAVYEQFPSTFSPQKIFGQTNKARINGGFEYTW